MHPSRYLKIYPADRADERLLFSTRKGSIARVPLQLAESLASGLVPEDVAEALASLGMAVKDPEAEQKGMLRFIDEVNRLDKAIQVSVILTLQCNFACPYCYEGTMKSAVEMSPETADALVEYVKSLWAPAKSELLLHFYGGEPLMATKLIRRIAGPLKAFASEKGATFYFTLVSNGSLLTPKVVRELLPYGLKNVKTTIDGPPDLHDATRPLRAGGSTFRKIIENLKSCPPGVKIGIGGNYTEGNFRRFPELLDILLAEGLGPDKIAEVAFNPVLKVTGRYANPKAGGCASISEPWLAEATIYLREEVARRGYALRRIIPSPCMIEIDSAFTVHCDGTLAQCPSLIGMPEYATGNVFTGATEYGQAFRVGHWKEDPACRECVYLPLCFGGCRYMSIQREGAPTTDCAKTFNDAVLGRLALISARGKNGG